MFLFSYPARLRTGRDRRVTVCFSGIPRVATDGKDKHEAITEAIDALGSELSIRLDNNETIPLPEPARRGEYLIPVPLWLVPRLVLYWSPRVSVDYIVGVVLQK